MDPTAVDSAVPATAAEQSQSKEPDRLSSKEKEKLCARAVKRREYAERRDKDNREQQEKDTRFVYIPMAQWDTDTVNLRREWGDPSLEFPQLKQFINQVVNDQRQRRPGIRVHPASEDASVKTADILQGMVRNIEYQSQAESVYDNGYLHAVVGGRGYWRVTAEYLDNETFNQSLCLRRIVNPNAVRLDPDYCMPDASDINWAYVEEAVPIDEFEKRWPDAEPLSLENSGTRIGSWWVDSETVIIADYYERKCTKRTLIALPNGATAFWDEVKELFGGVKPAGTRERPVEEYGVTWVTIAGGEQVIEEHYWPGSLIPIVQCAGDEIFVDGKRVFQGLITQAKSTQQLFNYGMTQQAIHLSLTPRAPYVAAAGQVEQYKGQWQTANTRNWGVLVYDPIEVNGTLVPAPQRTAPATPDAGWLNWTQQMTMLMKSIIGMYENNLGQRGQEISGRAIMAREQQGDNATFHYADNLGRAIAHTGRIILECIPYFYDAQQIVYIIGADDKRKPVMINQQQPTYDAETMTLANEIVNNDLSKGKYSVVIDSGPSYQTKRLEQADTVNQLVKVAPAIMNIAPDLVLKVQDIPGAEEFAERARVMLPPPIQQMLAAKDAGQDPEKAAMMQQLQDAQGQMQQAQQAIADLQHTVDQLQKDKEASIAASRAREMAAVASMENAQNSGTNPHDVEVEYAKQETERIKSESAQLKALADQQKQIMQMVQMVLESVTPQRPSAPQPAEQPEQPEPPMEGIM